MGERDVHRLLGAARLVDAAAVGELVRAELDSSGTAETGITATPISDSAAAVNGSRSIDVTRPSPTTIAARRDEDAASFFLGQRVLTVRYVRRMAARVIGRQGARGEGACPGTRRRASPSARSAWTSVLVGDDPASEVYVRRKEKAAADAGIRGERLRQPDDAEAELLACIDELNADDAVDGILVQLPLPKQIDAAQEIARSPRKDVDGLHPVNAGKLLPRQARLVPATPLGVLALLGEYGVDSARAPSSSAAATSSASPSRS